MLDFMQVRTYWCALSWRSHFSFERVLAVQLDRVGGFAWVNRQVDQVGVVGLLVVGGPPSVLLGPPALPRRAVPVLEELVVVELVAAGAGVALVLGDGVGHALVHVDVHLGAEHRHVVAWGGGGEGLQGSSAPGGPPLASRVPSPTVGQIAPYHSTLGESSNLLSSGSANCRFLDLSLSQGGQTNWPQGSEKVNVDVTYSSI